MMNVDTFVKQYELIESVQISENVYIDFNNDIYSVFNRRYFL